jgi:hypothetical protein
MRSFIRTNRTEIDTVINHELYRHDGRGGKGTIPNPPPKRNDAEREQWINNDEGLYNWARREGVPI